MESVDASNLLKMKTSNLTQQRVKALNPGVRFLFLAETVSDSPETGPDGRRLYAQLDYTNQSEVNGFVCSAGVDLDGVYIEFDPQMMVGGAKHSEFCVLCQQFTIGIWGIPDGIDNPSTIHALVDMGVAYVNSDFPRAFHNR